MNVGDTYTDAAGSHRVESVDAEGNATCTVLVTPSAEWIAGIPQPPAPPPNVDVAKRAMYQKLAAAAFTPPLANYVAPFLDALATGAWDLAIDILNAAESATALSSTQRSDIASICSANDVPVS